MAKGIIISIYTHPPYLGTPVAIVSFYGVKVKKMCESLPNWDTDSNENLKEILFLPQPLQTRKFWLKRSLATKTKKGL